MPQTVRTTCLRCVVHNIFKESKSFRDKTIWKIFILTVQWNTQMCIVVCKIRKSEMLYTVWTYNLEKV